MMYKILFLSLLTGIGIELYSQVQNPPGLNWKQIETEHFNVIVPESILQQGKRAASILESNWLPVNSSLEQKTKPISVFIFNQSVISNGYTSLGPRKIVFYSTPFQDPNLLGNTEWIEMLSIHEYRHAVQYSKLNQGFTYYMSRLLGDVGQSIFMNISMPAWVFEGDAVCTETALSNSGRGRLPSFVRDIRALELENKRYSYNQAYTGSYKVFFPNHYYLGYLMTSHIRKNYSDYHWNRVLNRSSNYSFWPFVLSGSLRKYTGNRLNKTYHNTLNEFDSIWSANIFSVEPDTFTSVSVNKSKIYTNYTFTFPIGFDSILALKSGMEDIPTLVLLTNRLEKKLLEMNPVDRIHSNGSQVVWSAYVPDVRWGERAYSDILVYDLKSDKKTQITRKGKYFAPAISPSGATIAVIEYGTDMQCYLTILESSTGSVVKRIGLPEGNFAGMPSWSDDEQQIVFVQSSKSRKTISILEINAGKIENLLPYSDDIISTCAFWKNYILYGTPILGIDGIAAFDLTTHETRRVITGKYGVYNPAISGTDSLVFEYYTTDGFRPGTIRLNPEKWGPLSSGSDAGDNYFKYLFEIEKSNRLQTQAKPVEITDSNVKNYNPLKHAVEIHSWLPYTVSGNGIGLSVYSNDKLNTLSATAGLEYFPSDAALRELVSLSYSGIFPVLKVDLSDGRKYTTFNTADTTEDLFGHNERLARVGVVLPFDFSRNVNYTALNLEAGYSYSHINFTDSIPAYMVESAKSSGIDISVDFANLKYTSKRQYYSRWGQQFSLFYHRAGLNGGDGNLNSFTLSSAFYFPGILKTHSLRILPGYEKNTTTRSYGIYWLSRKLDFTRSYEPEGYQEFYKLTSVYSMPLLYPDINIGRVLYCNRLRGDVFYDYGQTKIGGVNEKNFQSVGIDFNAEIYFASIPAPFEFGVRFSHRLTDNTNWIEFLIAGVAF